MASPSEPTPPQHTTFTHPEHLAVLPKPELTFLCHLECDMESFRPIGPGPYGNRMNVMFKGGQFEGPRMRGTLVAGGGDWEIVDPKTSIAYLDTRYVMETHDGAAIYIQTTGVRQGPKEILDALGEDTSIKATEYKMRLSVKMETGDERYSWLNNTVAIASAARNGSQVVYDMYAL